MRKILYTFLSLIALPFMFCLGLLYGALYFLQLLFRTINIGLEKVVQWVDENITSKMLWTKE